MIIRIPATVLLLIWATSSVSAQVTKVEAFPNLAFHFITDIRSAPDATDRIFVSERHGYIRVFPNNPSQSTFTTFLDITDRVVASFGEQSLASFAFHPDYASNGFFYVHYNADSPNRTVLSRFQVTADPDVADPNSELILLELAQPSGDHNGAQLMFGPDGYLYAGYGDGGPQHDPSERGEDPTNLYGTILRLDVDGNGQPPDCGTGVNLNYTIPPDNPFVGGPAANCDEIWAYGLRNPWRMAFGPDGKLWAADVGQDSQEEINWITPGANYGWDVVEGTLCHEPDTGCTTADLTMPIHEYTHDPATGGVSIIGGYIYTGTECPALTGKYIYGDFMSGHIWALEYDGGSVISNTMILDDLFRNISTFGLDSNGELYFSHYWFSVPNPGDAAGGVYKFDCPPVPMLNARAFLSGPFDGTDMSTALGATGLIPGGQPFQDAQFAATPLAYSGPESVPLSFFDAHPDIVDWVLVELRTGDPNSPPMTTVARRAALINQAGNITDVDGVGPVGFSGVAAGSYYVVIRHINHLALMSLAPVSVNLSPPLYDFTTAPTQAFGNDQFDLGGGRYGLYAGDANNDGKIVYIGGERDQLKIINLLGTGNLAGSAPVYHPADMNLTGTVEYIGANRDQLQLILSLGTQNLSGVIESNVPE